MSFNIKKPKTLKKIPTIRCKSIETLHEEKMNSFKKKSNDQDEIDYFLSVASILQKYYSIDGNDLDDNLKKRDLTEAYYNALGLTYINEVLAPKSVEEFCTVCKTEKIISNERFLTCTSCGIVDSDKILDGLNYSDECQINQIFVVDYKRINYFTEWLTQIQANETTEIPHELLEDIKIELRKKNITTTTKLTILSVKKILKDINMTKFYEHTPLIISKLSDSLPLSIPEELCNELKKMFLLIQAPFEKHKGTRKNFLSYPYILYKFCEILGLPEYLKHFSLLKSREKLMKTDILWKNIVDDIYSSTGDIKWVFRPSC